MKAVTSSRRTMAWLAFVALGAAASVAVAQDRSGPRAQADRELIEGERLYQEAMQLRASGNRDESNRVLGQAEAQFRSVLQHDPDKVAAAVRLSLILYAGNRSREAVPILEAALRRAPDNQEIKHQLGVHLFAVQRAQEGQALLEEVTRANPRLYDAQLLLARHYYSRTRQYEEAADRFRAYLRARPAALSESDAEIYGSIGNAYLAAERFADARAQYQKVLELADDNQAARINIAYSFFREGNFREATARYESLARADEPQPIVLANLARSLLKLRRAPAALQRARQLEKMQPRSHLGYLVDAEVMLATRRAGDAVTKVRMALQRAPRDVPTLLVAGTAFQATGDSATAQRHLETARRIEPENLDVIGGLATLYRQSGREREALPMFTKLTATRPRDPTMWAGLGACQYALGSDADAIAAFQAALERDANLALAKQGLAATHNRVAVAAVTAGNFADAKAALERALAVQSNDPRAHRNLGELLLRDGDAAGALRHLQCARAQPNDRDAAFLLGRALFATGQAAEAVTKLRAAKAGTGRTPDADVQMALGVALSVAGSHDEAITELRAAIGERPAPQKARTLSLALWRRAVQRIGAGQEADALRDLEAAQQMGRGLSPVESERLTFTIALAQMAAGDGRRALQKLAPLARSSAPYLAPPYDAVGIPFFSMYASYLSNDYRTFFNALRTVRARAPAAMNERLSDLELSARMRNAEALFSRGQFGPAGNELAAVRRMGRADDAIVRLADACILYARGRRQEAGVVFAELARRVRAGTDDVPRESLLDLGIFRDEVQNDDAGAIEALSQYIAMGGRHPEIARRLIDRKRRVLGIGGGQGGAE